MTVEQDFLPFATGVGANVPTQSSYSTNPDLPLGQQPGVASSSFNNKALRQANFITSAIANYLASVNGTDVLDNTVVAQMAACLLNAIGSVQPMVTQYLTGGSSGTHALTSFIQCASANATSGAVYSDGASHNFTVTTTITGGVQLQVTCTGGHFPAVGTGVLTLTKVSGTGDATITYYAVRNPARIRVRMVGAGGGGAQGDSGTSGTSGTATTFGTSLLTCNGGAFGTGSTSPVGSGGAGGSVSVTPTAGLTAVVKFKGGDGQGAGSNSSGSAPAGGQGGTSSFGNPGAGGGNSGSSSAAKGTAAAVNSGSGGGGGSSSGSSAFSGGGGGAGAYIEALITSPSATYAFAIGTGGTGGGSSGNQTGGNGADGQVIVEEMY